MSGAASRCPQGPSSSSHARTARLRGQAGVACATSPQVLFRRRQRPNGGGDSTGRQARTCTRCTAPTRRCRHRPCTTRCLGKDQGQTRTTSWRTESRWTSEARSPRVVSCRRHGLRSRHGEGAARVTWRRAAKTLRKPRSCSDTAPLCRAIALSSSRLPPALLRHARDVQRARCRTPPALRAAPLPPVRRASASRALPVLPWSKRPCTHLLTRSVAARWRHRRSSCAAGADSTPTVATTQPQRGDKTTPIDVSSVVVTPAFRATSAFYGALRQDTASE